MTLYYISGNFAVIICTMNTDFRIIREDDAPALIDFMTAIGGDTDNLTFSASDFASADQEAERFAIREMRKGRSVYAIAITDGKIIGSCTIHTSGDKPRIRHRAELAIAVRKEFWGTGVAQHLLEFSLAEARDRGITKINLEVRADNERAKTFYRRNGFLPEGTDSRLFYIDGSYVDGERFGLEL